MLIKLRKRSVQFVRQEERGANLNINCSTRVPEKAENVVSIGIQLFAFLSEHSELIELEMRAARGLGEPTPELCHRRLNARCLSESEERSYCDRLVGQQ
jgi:hypothetical protein